jgi:hypothetical protein
MKQLEAHVLDARMDAAMHVIVITGARPSFKNAGAL